MRQKRSQEFNSWKTLEIHLASRNWSLQGNFLSLPDRKRVGNCLTIWLCIIHDSFKGTRYERSASFASLAHWSMRQVDSDLSSLTDQLKQLLAVLRDCDNTNLTPTAFKQQCRSMSLSSSELGPAYLGVLMYLHSRNPKDYKIANTIIQFPLRLTLRDVDWIEKENIDAYFDFEESIKHQSYDEDLIRKLKKNFAYFASLFKFSDLRPCHGNGATAEVRRGGGALSKFCNIYAYPEILGYANAYETYLPWDPLPTYRIPCGTVQLVPKGIDKKRVISMEDTSHQYFQKGIADAMQRTFTRDRRFKIYIEDQSKNRMLALEGSKEQRYSTIDLSNASDSVTATLVRELAVGTQLYPYLFMFRTKIMKLNGRCIVTEKYAPMGSALCFPVECLVFSTIIRTCLQDLGMDKCHYLVYGDDLVVPSVAAPYIIDMLEKLHFSVNREKSFVSSWFTESCGIECVRGYDVSPTRISRKWDIMAHYDRRSATKHPTQIGACVDLCNTLLAEGYTTARRYVLRHTLKVYPSVPFGIQGGLASAGCPDNHHLEKRWNSDLQREEVHVQQALTVSKKIGDNARYALLQREFALTDRERLLCPQDRIDVQAGPTRTILRMVWVPTEI